MAVRLPRSLPIQATILTSPRSSTRDGSRAREVQRFDTPTSPPSSSLSFPFPSRLTRPLIPSIYLHKSTLANLILLI